MGVNFRFVKSNGEASPVFTHGCFGTLMYHSVLRSNTGNKNYNIQDYDYLEYMQHGTNYDNHTTEFKKWARKDTAFKLKLFRSIVRKFPWMREVIKVRYSDENTLISSSPETKASKYTLVARLDLSKPGDTVWFCLNLFRLITRFSYSNGISSEYKRVGGTSPLKTFYELTEGDAWKTVLLTYGFNTALSAGFDGKYSELKMNYATMGNTVLTSMNYIDKKSQEQFINNPEVFLNKNFPVNSKDHSQGLAGKMGSDYFISHYQLHIPGKVPASRYIYGTADIIETLFGKELLEKIQSYKLFKINLVDLSKNSDFSVMKYNKE